MTIKYVLRIPAASELDLAGMEKWLEKLALKGLYLKWFRSYPCCFTLLATGLATCPLDWGSIRQLKKVEQVMEEGIPLEHLPIPPLSELFLDFIYLSSTQKY